MTFGPRISAGEGIVTDRRAGVFQVEIDSGICDSAEVTSPGEASESENLMQRRTFLMTAMTATLGAALRDVAAEVPQGRGMRILLRSSWQVVNIGDIAHTPGVLALIEKHLPEAEVRLWASGDLSAEVAEMEHQRFPRLKIVKGRFGADGKPSSSDLKEAVEWADFLLHGSGPSLVAETDVAAFEKYVGKPFGVYGITYSSGTESQQQLLSRAKFVYFRDPVSLKLAKSQGIRPPVMEFGPDGAFACDLRDDASAEKFLKDHQLQEQKFLCCIPRLRYTPYWLIKSGREKDESREARNNEMREHDHAPLREAITRIVRESDYRVLVCPEDMTQMTVGKENLIDKLPEDVRKRVVWRDSFWLTDEALSTYVRSAGLFGLEMHSPIMAIGNGIPAIVGRFAEQTSKGFMWQEIGLSDWLFDFDKPEELQKYVPAVLSLIDDPKAAQEKAAAARKFVEQRQAETMQVVGKGLA